ncbi:MAG: TonB family protein [Verrucomicrobia bacterium]|nr:TonB family protein [Verrucomicrobiota bacterium]
MDRTLQRSLMGSTAAHAAVLLAAILVGGLTARNAMDLNVPVLEILPSDLQLTMGDQAGGGTPNPLPQGPREIAGSPPAQPQPVPAPAPAPQPPPPVVPKVQTPPQPAPAVKEPPAKPAPSKEPEAPAPPVRETAPKIEVAKTARAVTRAQDVDATRLADKPVKVTPAKTVEIASTRRKRTEDDARAATEAIEAAASARRAQEQRLASAQSLAARIAGAASGVSKNVGATTQIQALGPGGKAYAPYYSYLQATLKREWRKPATSSEQTAQATVQLVIAKDGSLFSADLTKRSGVAALDASVEEIFRRVRRFDRLPPDFNEARMIVPVTFVLDSSLSQ